MPPKRKKRPKKPKMRRSKKRKSILLLLLKSVYGILAVLVKALIGFAAILLTYLFKTVSFSYSHIIGKSKKLVRNGLRKSPEPSYSKFEEVEGVEGSIAEFEDSLYEEPSLIGLIVGARGSGKSALGMRVLENVKAKGRKVAAMGFKESSLPKWVKPIKSIEEIENGSFVLIDEGGIEFSSRAAMSSANKLLTELMLIARHKDLSILFITQNSANIEVNTLRQVDYLLLKRPSLLQLDFERKKIKDIYSKAKEGFERHEGKGVFYVYAHNFIGFASAPLPSFWSEKLSKSYC